MSGFVTAFVVATMLAAPMAPAPAVTPTEDAAPAPAPDPAIERQRRGATAMVVTGGTTMAVGGAALLFVALPARALYLRSLEEAQDAQWVTEREAPARLARDRHELMLISAATGASLLAVGTVILAVGSKRRQRLRSERAATFSMAPAIGRGQWGAAASVRF